MTMALSLKALRVNADLSRREVAEATGIHENTLANYENFVSIPDINKAKTLASFYNCSVDDIKWSKQ
jgi:transcriptional regulator with XRE-family HTH domain